MESEAGNQIQGTGHQTPIEYSSQNQDNNEIMSTKDWVITILISSIPLVGLIMLLVWAFGDSASPIKANWAKANLIVYLIMFALVFVFYIVLFAFLGSSFLAQV